MAITRFNKHNRELEAKANEIIKASGILSKAFPEHVGRWTEIPNDNILNLKHIDWIAQDGFNVDLKGIDNQDHLAITVFRKYESGNTENVMNTAADAYIILNMKPLVTEVYTINKEQINNIIRDCPINECRKRTEKTEVGTRIQYVADLAFPTERGQIFGTACNEYLTFVSYIPRLS